MGVMIYLNIMPNHIDEADWSKVYEETLEIINGYPFLDSIFDSQTYGCNWKYVTRTKERMIKFADHQIGWHTIGDEMSLKMGESFFLIKDIHYYRNDFKKSGNCDDILFSSIHNYLDSNEEFERLRVADFVVFDAKTQGEPYHIPLLAIACLIESRFPEQAIVTGDISIGQMETAVKWVNSILKHPITLTERADNEKLLFRIKKVVKDEYSALEMLLHSTMRELDVELGNLIRRQFRPETIVAYFLYEFKRFKIGTLGFSTELAHFIKLGFRLEDASELCVFDPAGCKYDAKEFAKEVLSMEWATEEGSLVEPISMEINAPNSTNPETVNSIFGKTFLQLAGFQETLKSNLSFEQVVRILQDQLGDLCDIDLIVAEMSDSKENSTDLFDEFYSELEKYVEPEELSKAQFTITDAEDLIAWKYGDTIHPGLEKGIFMVKEFVERLLEKDKELFANFQNMTNKDKMRKLIQSNRFFYIHKKVWDEISDNIDETQMINKILGVLSIKAEEININKLCKSLVNNQELFQAYIFPHSLD